MCDGELLVHEDVVHFFIDPVRLTVAEGAEQNQHYVEYVQRLNMLEIRRTMSILLICIIVWIVATIFYKKKSN